MAHKTTHLKDIMEKPPRARLEQHSRFGEVAQKPKQYQWNFLG